MDMIRHDDKQQYINIRIDTTRRFKLNGGKPANLAKIHNSVTDFSEKRTPVFKAYCDKIIALVINQEMSSCIFAILCHCSRPYQIVGLMD